LQLQSYGEEGRILEKIGSQLKEIECDTIFLCSTENEGQEKIIVEIQKKHQCSDVERALYYWARAYSEILKQSMNYYELFPVYVISILEHEILNPKKTNWN